MTRWGKSEIAHRYFKGYNKLSKPIIRKFYELYIDFFRAAKLELITHMSKKAVESGAEKIGILRLFSHIEKGGADETSICLRA